MTPRRAATALVAAFSFLVAWAGSTQTGTLRGTIIDTGKEPVVGAVVTLRSPSLIREVAVLTDAKGNWFAPGLPAGAYTVTVRLEGYVTMAQDATVEVDKTAQLPFVLKSGELSETVTVTAEKLPVDKSATEKGVLIEKSFTEKLPVGRSDLSLMLFAPAVTDTDGDGNANVLGGTSNSNNYLVDGAASRDPVTGTFGLNLNYDAIEAVDFKLTGISAEYGEFQGGVSNLITKSGGNEFTGSLRDVVTDPAWVSPYGGKSGKFFASSQQFVKDDGSVATYVPEAPTPRHEEDYTKNNRVSTTLGGPAIPDRLWFFVAYDRIDESNVAFLGNGSGGALGNGTYSNFFDSDMSLIKMTLQIGNNNRIGIHRSSDPALSPRCYGSIFFGGPCYDSFNVDNQKQGGFFWIGNWSGTWASTWLTDLKVARFRNGFDIKPLTPIIEHPGLPLGRSGPGPAIDIFGNGATYDANIFDEFPERRQREQYEAAVTKFIDSKRTGTHTIKLGADYHKSTDVGNTAVQGDALFLIRFADAPAPLGDGDPYDPNNREYYLWYDYQPPNNSTPKNLYTAVYVNDDWQLNQHWSFNLGLRWERSDNRSDIGEKIIDSSGFAPRLGVSFDPTGQGKHVIKGTAARYLAGINLTTLTPFVRQAGGLASYDLYFNGAFPAVGTPDWHLIASVRPDTTGSTYAKGIKPQRIDEVGLGYEFLVSPTIGLSARFVDRTWRDTLVTKFNFTYPDGTTPVKVGILENSPEAKRSYKGVILGMDKRFSAGWQMSAYYTYSRARGNVVSDQGFDLLGSYPGVPELVDNRYGKLAWDVPHTVKVQSSWAAPLKNKRHDLSFGAVLNYQSGEPYTRNNTQSFVVGPGPDGVQDTPLGTLNGALPGTDLDQQATGNVFFEPQGSNRAPNIWNLDTSVNWRFRIGKQANWETRLEVFNVTDEQAPIAVNSSWDPDMPPQAPGDLPSLNNVVFGHPTSHTQFQVPRTYRLQFALTW